MVSFLFLYMYLRHFVSEITVTEKKHFLKQITTMKADTSETTVQPHTASYFGSICVIALLHLIIDSPAFQSPLFIFGKHFKKCLFRLALHLL